jgi:histone acetyltransferase (RNA polymerase elongator complex component)
MTTANRRPFVIPVFLPHHGCPHQCVFCNQNAITGRKGALPSPGKVRQIVKTFLNFKGKSKRTVQIAFYGGNFLGLRTSYIEALLNEASRFVENGAVESLRFSTRPDTIDSERLDILHQYPVATVELGVQSMDDHVLAISKRGHTALQTMNAVKMLKGRKYEIGLQIMVGLPGDDDNRALETGRRIVGLDPDFVRIYPTVVLANSRLAKWYARGWYAPLPLDRCVQLVKKLFLLFCDNHIRVVRMGLQASADLQNGEDLLAGPFHPSFGHLIYSEVLLDLAKAVLESLTPTPDNLTINIHPRNISTMRGLKNRNIETLKKQFGLKTITIIPDVTGEGSHMTITDRLSFLRTVEIPFPGGNRKR